MRLLILAAATLALLGCRGTPTESTLVPSGPSVPSPSEPEPDVLHLAAECLERGDCGNAAIHLEAYVCRHPEQIMFRAQLAELLLRAGRDSTARAHYEQFIIDAQSATGAPRQHLVTAHTRLMEIARRRDDDFAELFHRGVGLLLLAKEHDAHPDAEAAFSEEMLCKAMKALNDAKELNSLDARVRVYLAEIHDRLGNRRAADAERAAVRLTPIPNQLTPIERRTLPLN